MQNISKSQVSQWLLLDLMAQKSMHTEKSQLFSKKYNSDFADFENKIENAEKEDFEAWDDLIEWKALESVLKEIDLKIIDIKNGFFQMAG